MLPNTRTRIEHLSNPTAGIADLASESSCEIATSSVADRLTI